MRLGVKHSTQQTVVRADFSGGLNVTTTPEGIAENQLVWVTNMEVDHSTGMLKTVGGTVDILSMSDIYAALWDGINQRFLIVTSDKTVYIAGMDGTIGDSVGSLSGSLYPKGASWEDGLLIASGSKLQYYNGETLLTISDSPECDEVYVRSGRVIVSHGTEIRYSGVGDETNWSEDSNDPSTSQWVEAGYKDGGNFIGMVALSTDIMIIKDNKRVYRLTGEYPDWSIYEVSRNVECSGRMSICNVSDSVIVVGKNEVQQLATTEQYGDVKPGNLASLVTSKIQELPDNATVRYVPPLNQIWAIGNNGSVMMFDMASQAWYMRQFNSDCIDVISIGDAVFVVKNDRISMVSEGTFDDAGSPMMWGFQAQRMVSQHEYLLKRTQINVTPLSHELYTGEISVGAVRIGLPIPKMYQKIYHNRSPIWKNRAKICLAARVKGVYMSGEKIYRNPTPIYGNKEKIFHRNAYIKESRNVFRSKHLDIMGRGSMGGFILGGIVMDIAEV